jgi:hypothetical protein
VNLPKHSTILRVACALLVAACGSGRSGSAKTCALGSEKCPCYGNGTCDSELECRSHVCVAGGNGGESGAPAVSSESGRGAASGSGAEAGAGGDETSAGKSGDGGAGAGDGEAGASGAGGAAGAPAEAGDGTALGRLNQQCATEGAYACAGHAQKGQLVCSGGKWATNGTCPSGTNCDSTLGGNAGSCSPIVAGCSVAGARYCASASVEQCGVDLVTTLLAACPMAMPVCLNGACVECTPGTGQCAGPIDSGGIAPDAQTCTEAGIWSVPGACDYGCCSYVGTCC